jgi:hypothetical protein
MSIQTSLSKNAMDLKQPHPLQAWKTPQENPKPLKYF